MNEIPNDNVKPRLATEKSTTQKVAEMAHDVVDKAAAKAEPTEHKVRAKAEEAKVQAEVRAYEARDRGRELFDEVSEYVKEHPVSSAGIAFAAGMLFSSILRR